MGVGAVKLELVCIKTRTDLFKSPWCWERLKVGGEGDDRGWDGWMASLTQWTWVWVSSRRWWWPGKPDVLPSMGLDRTEWLNWTEGSLCWTMEKAFLFSRITLEFLLFMETFMHINIFKKLWREDHGIWSHHFMANRWGNSENSVRLYFGGSKITTDGDYSHEI